MKSRNDSAILVSSLWTNSIHSEAMTGDREAMTACTPEREAYIPAQGSASRSGCSECYRLSCALSDTIAAILIHAQVLEHRLPPYSRLRRPVLEMQRQAQRGAAMLRRWLPMNLGDESSCEEFCEDCMARGQRDAGRCGPELSLAGMVNSAPSAATPVDSGSREQEGKLTLLCDACTSRDFPKRDDVSEG